MKNLKSIACFQTQGGIFPYNFKTGKVHFNVLSKAIRGLDSPATMNSRFMSDLLVRTIQKLEMGLK